MIAAGRILGQRDNVGKLVDLAKAMMESEDPNPRLVHDVIGIIHFLAASDYLLANANPGNDAVFARLMLAEVLGSKNIAEARRLTESKLESDRKEIVSLKDKMDAESTSRKKNDLKRDIEVLLDSYERDLELYRAVFETEPPDELLPPT